MENLIGIFEVKKIFKLSIDAIRKYKKLGFIEPCKRVGRKDFYDKEDVEIIRDLIAYYKHEKMMSLDEIVKEINYIKELERNTGILKLLIIGSNEKLIDLIMQELKSAPNSKTELEIYVKQDIELGRLIAKKIKPDKIILGLLIPPETKKEIKDDFKLNQFTCHAELFSIVPITIKGEQILPPNTYFFDEFIDKFKTLMGLE